MRKKRAMVLLMLCFSIGILAFNKEGIANQEAEKEEQKTEE